MKIKDKQTKALLLAHPLVIRRDRRELTKQEEDKFARVSYDHLANLLQFLYQGERVTLENINPNTGEVKFIDGINGGKFLPLTSLDYELRDFQRELDGISSNEIYIQRSKSRYAQAYN